MANNLILAAGCTPAVGFARAFLETSGISVTATPSRAVTHLLLDIPSFGPGGTLRGGGNPGVWLDSLDPGVVICGGKLNHPDLAKRSTIDFLEDPWYLAENAYITAECALEIALSRLPCLIRGCPVLILGWGRIGKSLAFLLKGLGARVSVAARKETDRSMLRALDYAAADISRLEDTLRGCRLLFNTVPHMLLTEAKIRLCREDCVKIDLASQPGMDGPGVITARGLPGLHRPEASGRLIAETMLRLIGKEDTK